MDLEFSIEYPIKNKNLFYFKYYCVDYNEFDEWIQHNDIDAIYDEFHKNQIPTLEEYKTWTEIYRNLYIFWYRFIDSYNDEQEEEDYDY